MRIRWPAAALALLAWTLTSPPIARAKGPAAPKPIPAGILTGAVRDASGGALSNIEVTVTWEGLKTALTAKTDERGAFSLKRVPSGDVLVLVRGKGLMPDQRRLSMPRDKGVALDVTLQGGVQFAGRVVDARGAPISGAKVETGQWMDARKVGDVWWYRPKRNDKKFSSFLDGSFAVDALRPSAKYTLTLTHPHFVEVVLPEMPVEAGGAREDLFVQMADAAWVAGVVVDPAGKPVPEARVRLRGTEGAVAFDEDASDFFEDGKMQPRTATGSVSDEQGRFEFGGVEGSQVDVRIWADGFFDGDFTWTELVIGKAKVGVRAALEPAKASLDGRVMRGTGGAAVPGAEVLATGDAGRTPRVVTDAKGEFHLKRVKSRGPVSLLVRAEGFVDVEVGGIALDSKTIDVAMQAVAMLHLKVVDGSGKALESAQLKTWVGAVEKDDPSGLPFGPYVRQTPAGMDHPLPVGEVYVKVSHPEFESQTLGPWTAAEGQRIDAGTVTLVRR